MKRILIIVISIFLGAMQLTSQVNLISSYPPASALSGSAFSTYQSFITFPKFSSVQIVQFNSLGGSINNDGNLQIDLTSDDCGILEFEPQNSRYINEESYYYYGTLKPPTDTCQCTCSDGEIMIESREGRKFGYIVIDDIKYEFLALNSEYSIIGKLNAAYFANFQECIVSSNTGGEGLKVPELQLTPRTGGCAIRVLFLYTQNAEDAFGGLAGITDMANLAINQTNQAFSNSAINNTCVINANVREWVGFTETPADFDGDLEDLRTSNQVAIWRNTDLADVVILITDAGYNGGILGGVPTENLGNPQNNFAFGAIEGSSFTANFTFSHELGHIIGCRHQTCAQYDRDPSNPNKSCDDNGTFEHGLGWGERKCWLCSWKNKHTIMYQLRSGWERIPHYSNPNVFHNGKYNTGEALRDNARWINEGHACTVAAYRQNPFIPLSASINGDDILCVPLSGEYIADVSGSNGPFTFIWNISTDGVNWGNTAGTNQNIWINSNNYSLKKTVFLRVRVQDATGNFVFAFFQISIRKKGTKGCDFQYLSSGGNGKTVIVYPNPVNQALSVEFNVPKNDTNVQIEIQDGTGRAYSSSTKTYSEGVQVEQFNTDYIANGLFIVRTKIDGASHYIKVVKIE